MVGIPPPSVKRTVRTFPDAVRIVRLSFHSHQQGGVAVHILVTGATGFLGVPICQALLNGGDEVAGTRRSTSDISRLPSGVHPILLDTWDENSILTALRGCQGVVHLVARTHRRDAGDPQALPLYREINVTLTEILLRCAVRAGVRRFLFLSSIKAVGEGAGSPYDETSPCAPEDSYGVSKREAEDLVRAAGNLETVILRIPLAYGPGVKGNFRRMMGAVNRGTFLPLGGIRNARSLVFSRNLADAVRVCLHHPDAPGRTFHVADRETPSTPELVRALAEALGVAPRLLPVPPSLLSLAGALMGRRETVRKLTSNLVVRTDAIQSTLGWHPPSSLQEGLLSTVSSEVQRS